MSADTPAPLAPGLIKRWADEGDLTMDESRLLVEWAVSLAVTRGTWSAVKVDLADEHGLAEQDAEDLALQLRILAHHLACASAPQGGS